MEDEAVRVSGLTADEIVDKIMADERLIDLFAMTWSAAAWTDLEGKRLLLGRNVGKALRDDAEIDPALLQNKIIAELERPHVNVLRALESEHTPRNTHRIRICMEPSRRRSLLTGSPCLGP